MFLEGDVRGVSADHFGRFRGGASVAMFAEDVLS